MHGLLHVEAITVFVRHAKRRRCAHSAAIAKRRPGLRRQHGCARAEDPEYACLAQARPMEKRIWRARAQSPQSSKCEVLERLKRPESRSWLLQLPVWQNHWQVSGGLRGLRRLRGLKGSFGPLEKRIWRARAQSPQSAQLRPQSGTEPRAHSQVRGFGASEASRIQKQAAPTASMAAPWASFGGLRRLRGLKDSFGPLEKKDLARQSPEPTVWQLRPQSSKCEVLQRLQRPESRSRLLQLPVWQNHGQVSGGLRGLRRLRGLKDSFGPLEKKDLARQSPEPAVYATAPTVWHRAQSPQSSKCEALALERLKRPESRSWLLQLPVWQNHWQVSGGLRGLRR